MKAEVETPVERTVSVTMTEREAAALMYGLSHVASGPLWNTQDRTGIGRELYYTLNEAGVVERAGA